MQPGFAKSLESTNKIPSGFSSISSKKTPLGEINSIPPSGQMKPVVPQIQRSFSNAGQQINKQKSFDIDISKYGFF